MGAGTDRAAGGGGASVGGLSASGEALPGFAGDGLAAGGGSAAGERPTCAGAAGAPRLVGATEREGNGSDDPGPGSVETCSGRIVMVCTRLGSLGPGLPAAAAGGEA